MLILYIISVNNTYICQYLFKANHVAGSEQRGKGTSPSAQVWNTHKSWGHVSDPGPKEGVRRVRGSNQPSSGHWSPCLREVCVGGCGCSSPSLTEISTSSVSVTHSQPQSKIVKWKISEINNPWVLNCAPFWVAWWHLVSFHSSHSGSDSSLCPGSPRCTCHQPRSLSSHLGDQTVLSANWAILVSQCSCSPNPYFTQQWSWSARVVRLAVRTHYREATKCLLWTAGRATAV